MFAGQDFDNSITAAGGFSLFVTSATQNMSEGMLPSAQVPVVVPPSGRSFTISYPKSNNPFHPVDHYNGSSGRSTPALGDLDVRLTFLTKQLTNNTILYYLYIITGNYMKLILLLQN